jgi:bifunctional non-homologous end joining protein LigD
VRLSHPDRVFWPDVGVTKEGLAAYYAEIADRVLPHVADRPLSFVRCPDGVAEKCFFQKHAWAGLDEKLVRRVKVGDDEALSIRNLDGLLALVQAGVLEIHPWGAKVRSPEKPDRITVDLDPGEDVPWPVMQQAAREVRERLRLVGHESFLKVTGGKGLHVVVPLKARAGWDEVKAFAQGVASEMARDASDRFTVDMTKAVRRGRIYVDYLRNGRGATAVAAYSTRARAGAPVSTPLDWEELDTLTSGAFYTLANVPARLAHLSTDPWAEMDEAARPLVKVAAHRSRARTSAPR